MYQTITGTSNLNDFHYFKRSAIMLGKFFFPDLRVVLSRHLFSIIIVHHTTHRPHRHHIHWFDPYIEGIVILSHLLQDFQDHTEGKGKGKA